MSERDIERLTLILRRAAEIARETADRLAETRRQMDEALAKWEALPK